MAEIHYAVHITLGSIVLIVSLLQAEMRIFAIAGIGFIIWGLFKLLIHKKKQKSNPKKTHTHNSHSPHAHNNHHHHMHQRQSKYKICPNCGKITEKINRFCPYCNYGV